MKHHNRQGELQYHFSQLDEMRFYTSLMSLLVLSPSSVTPGALAGELHNSSGVLFSSSRVSSGAIAQSCYTWCSCPVMSILQHSRSHVTPGALAQSCHSWSTCPVVSLLELYPSQVSPGTHSLSCHYISTRPFISLLEHLPSHITPAALAESRHS